MIQEQLEESVQPPVAIAAPIIHVLVPMASVAQPMVGAIVQPLHQASVLLEQPVPSQTLAVSGAGPVLDRVVALTILAGPLSTLHQSVVTVYAKELKSAIMAVPMVAVQLLAVAAAPAMVYAPDPSMEPVV